MGVAYKNEYGILFLEVLARAITEWLIIPGDLSEGTMTTIERGCFNINTDPGYSVDFNSCYDLKSVETVSEILQDNFYYPGLGKYRSFVVKPCNGDLCNTETARGAQFCDAIQNVSSVGFLRQKAMLENSGTVSIYGIFTCTKWCVFFCLIFYWNTRINWYFFKLLLYVF